MKNYISNLNKAFENRLRLGIMSILITSDWVEFNVLKELLEATDGNLASHITALEKIGYLEVRKAFIGKKPNTSFRITKEGKKAFKDHIDGLEQLIKKSI
ncbi:MAG: winged helix-turn-helix domain-containing protein [Cytophaga sp.]|uniref:winged helix-turn-helix domain-containing protein n=1 Tax=Cytophaga sp. TaxID=29535 RepID=UPI003F7D5945